MRVHIKIANTPALLEGVFKVRHAVFSEQESLLDHSADGRVLDRFDAYQTSTNIVAVVEGRVVGSIRIILDSEVGLHADELYDFTAVTPDGVSRASIGHFCILQEYRSNKIAMALMLLASYFTTSQGANWILAPVNPAIAPMLRRIGFKPVGKPFNVPGITVQVLPMTLDVNELQDIFIDFIRKNERFNFLESYECQLFGTGERVIRAGDIGDTAYIIFDGEMEVINPTNGEVMTTLGQGDIVGEMAMFADGVHTAHVDAKSNIRAMILRKKVFLERLRSHPDEAVNQLKFVAQRMLLRNV